MSSSANSGGGHYQESLYIDVPTVDRLRPTELDKSKYNEAVPPFYCPYPRESNPL